MSTIRNGKISSGSTGPKRVCIRTDRTREDNELAADFLRVQRNADPAYRAWEAEMKRGALGPTKSAQLRTAFKQHLHKPKRSDEDQALLQLIESKLKQTL